MTNLGIMERARKLLDAAGGRCLLYTSFEKDTVCSEWGAANAKEADLHGGVPASFGGSNAGLPQHFCVGQRVGCAASLAV